LAGLTHPRRAAVIDGFSRILPIYESIHALRVTERGWDREKNSELHGLRVLSWRPYYFFGNPNALKPAVGFV
jgi:hypothetical protein